MDDQDRPKRAMRRAAAAAGRPVHFIDGQWMPAATDELIAVIDPATEEIIAQVPAGTPRDVDRAVTAARRVFGDWSSAPLNARIAAVERVGELMAERREEIALLITGELGMPLHVAREVQVDSPARVFGTIGGHAERIAWERHSSNATVMMEPIGVVGAITPWNFPLEQIAVKVAPALVAGCTVVLKPSEVTPLSALVLAELVEAAGLPAGVFNVVNGFGPVAGEALAGHPGIDKVSFTGSTRAGRRVSAVAGANVTSVTVELGGKSPNVILDDAPLERAVAAGVDSCFFNAGQTCSALTRMLVPRERLAEAEEVAVAVARRHAIGDPFSEGTSIGPLVSATQRDRVRGYIACGIDEGAELLLGGAGPPEQAGRGYFVSPTVFSSVSADMRIAREEIFGPVLAIIPYDGESEAVELANDTAYGLAAAVWAGSDARAVVVARRIRAGQVQINGAEDDPSAPFGGFKQSGHGRENGTWGIEGFLAPKAVLS